MPSIFDRVADVLVDKSASVDLASGIFKVFLASLSAGEDQGFNRLNVVGVDASGNINKWAIDAAGQLFVVTESPRKTYTLAGFVTPGAGPTDIIQLAGAAATIARIVHIRMWLSATAAGTADLLLIRRSTTDTGGTSTTPTIGRHATADGAPAVVGTVWTANPAALGTLVANLGAARTTMITSGIWIPYEWAPSTHNDKAFQLNGAAEFLCINGNGNTLLTGETWAYEITWTESTD